ncbi:MAG: hypothetical protein QXT86_08785 [Archaeoglobaceae archaeon]
MVARIRAKVRVDGNVMYITFPRPLPLRGEVFREFLETNGLQEYLVVFSPTAPEGAVEREFWIPIPKRNGYRRLREVLKEALNR